MKQRRDALLDATYYVFIYGIGLDISLFEFT